MVELSHRAIRIQIWTGGVGGHAQAATAIAEALRELDHNLNVNIIDTFTASATASFFSRIVYSYDTVVARFPFVWGMTWAIVNIPIFLNIIRKGGRILTRKNFIQNLILKSRPDAIVKVIADLGQLRLVAEGGSSKPHIFMIVTDLVTIHHAWMTSEVNSYILPTSEAAIACKKHGIPQEKMMVIGFPILTSRFCQNSPKNIQVNVSSPFRILMMGGTSGSGRILADIKLLLRSDLNLDITIVCGKNRGLYKKIQHLCNETKHIPKVNIFGFTDQIAQLMQQSDLLITKGGPTTAYEAIASHLPMIINSCLPGQEQGNDTYFARKGVALLARTPEETLNQVRMLYKDRDQLNILRNDKLAQETCEAASRIAKYILKTIQQN